METMPHFKKCYGTTAKMMHIHLVSKYRRKVFDSDGIDCVR